MKNDKYPDKLKKNTSFNITDTFDNVWDINSLQSSLSCDKLGLGGASPWKHYTEGKNTALRHILDNI